MANMYGVSFQHKEPPAEDICLLKSDCHMPWCNFFGLRNNQVEEPQLSAWFHPKLRDQHLIPFIRSADEHFMVGYRVIFYILIDDFTKLPYVELGPRRTFKVFPLFDHQTWQGTDLKCMNSLDIYITDYMQHEVNFLFNMTINQMFEYDFGVETLGRSVAQLHVWWYFKSTQEFPYERRASSAAFIPFGKGDFYYHHAILGGTPREVLTLLEQCLQGNTRDTTNKLTSLYESHLNKYFFVNKPTKLLSREYNWDPSFKIPPQIKHVKIAWQPEMF
ncbi:N-acetyllactosaminide alpha-1,3-galactosyltransferase-like 1 [Fukomys damarensis]|uniref:N-acetyllactosaminide alpha-1,3-galactosyltransferase-like 1 n=1 Tax=Fukomys damarensis TaxID=885580 RepID=UPI001455388D|nr:N-acetyllactosaminide alpha-1,3-galactosyltransferase-like 1 [Fukomys damarensis]